MINRRWIGFTDTVQEDEPNEVEIAKSSTQLLDSGERRTLRVDYTVSGAWEGDLQSFQEIEIPGATHVEEEGAPAVPKDGIFVGCVISTSAGASMQVEVDVFSGRPNPLWDLTAHEANEFVDLFQALPEYQGEGSVRDGLGYRGLIVTQLGDHIEEYNEIVISYGIVVARENGQSKQFTDKERRLEQWLFQTGRRELDEGLYQQIIQQLD